MGYEVRTRLHTWSGFCTVLNCPPFLTWSRANSVQMYTAATY
jgi:hypothetical protein